jgi:hypothetical protein
MQEVLLMCKIKMQCKIPLRFSRVSKVQIENKRHLLLIGRITKSRKGEELQKSFMGKTKVTKIILFKTLKNQFRKLDHGQQVQTQRFILKLEIREKKRVPTNRGYIH